MKDLKISVIVPVYNVENYIRQCLDSICNQTYKNLEILVVDDGSPDNCPQICDEYAQKDSRIKVFHQKNGGQSVARNLALRQCAGDIIAFVDSDDYLELNAYETLINFLVDNDLDIVFMSANIVQDEEILETSFHFYPNGTICAPNEIFRKVLRDEIGGQPYLKIYRKECFENVCFPEGRIYEDLAISHLPFAKAKRDIGFIDISLYNYRVNLNSTSRRFNPSKTYNIHLAFVDHLNYAREYSKDDINICLKKATTFGLGVVHLSWRFDWKAKKQEVYNAKKFLKEHKKEILKCKEFSRGKKISLRLYYYFRPLYYMLAKILKSKKEYM